MKCGCGTACGKRRRSQLAEPSNGIRACGGGPPVHQAASSPEGLPEKLKGVGAIPVAPVVGGEGGEGLGMAAANDGALRATLVRMLPG